MFKLTKEWRESDEEEIGRKRGKDDPPVFQIILKQLFHLFIVK